MSVFDLLAVGGSLPLSIHFFHRFKPFKSRFKQFGLRAKSISHLRLNGIDFNFAAKPDQMQQKNRDLNDLTFPAPNFQSLRYQSKRWQAQSIPIKQIARQPTARGKQF